MEDCLCCPLAGRLVWPMIMKSLVNSEEQFIDSVQLVNQCFPSAVTEFEIEDLPEVVFISCA